MHPIDHQKFVPSRKPVILPELESHHTNLDPDFSFQGVIYVTIHLQMELSLNFIEIISLLSCVDCIGHNLYYYISSAILYITKHREDRKDRRYSREHYFGKGIEFGWRFLQFMLKLYYKEYNDSGGFHTASMHNRYIANPKKNPKEEENGKNCMLLYFLLFLFWLFMFLF